MTQYSFNGTSDLGKTRYYDPTLPSIPKPIEVIDVQVVPEEATLEHRVADLEYNQEVLIQDNIRLSAENDTMRVWFMGILPAGFLILLMMFVNLAGRVNRLESRSIPVPPAASQSLDMGAE